jgi:hypothetical protein
MKKTFLAALVLAGSTALAACGGGSSGTSSGGGGGGTYTPPNKVEGPLDALQDPVSGQVFAPLISATAGTPLEGVLVCADQIVVQDTLDIVDALALALQESATGTDPAAAFQAAADNIASGLTGAVGNLSGLLAALGGDADACLGGGTAPDGSNPLAGTPLEAFGAALAPVLAQIQSAIETGDGAGGPPGLDALTGLVAQLNGALDAAFAQLPSELTDAPVVGPALGAVQQLLADVGVTLGFVLSADAEGAAGSLTSAVENVLGTLLTGVVPVGDLEGMSGNPGDISGAITNGIASLTEALQGILGGGSSGLPLDIISTLLDPLQDSVLGNIFEPIQDALAGGGSNPLFDALGSLTDLFGGVGGGSSPLQPVLDLIFGLVGGGGGGSCNIPLLCGLLGL